MTVADASTITSGQVNAEVAVIGGGPAGLTIAMDLASTGAKVVVLESGTRTATPEARDRDVGESVGHPLRFVGNDFTTADMRLRALGGASGHWTGMCRPLDPIDFRRRDWRTGSGWPIDADDLAPWYLRAASTLRLGDTGWDPLAWYERSGTEPLFSSDRLDQVVYQFSDPVHFGEDFSAVLDAADGPQVLLGATVVAAQTEGRQIRSVSVRTDADKTLTVTADRFVLAAGGLEVPRLLLGWGGVANSSGRVGVGYHDHPHLDGGWAHLAASGAKPPLFDWTDTPGDEAPTKVWAGWAPTEEVQEAERIGNAVVILEFFTPDPADVEQTPPALSTSITELLAWAGTKPNAVARLNLRCEQVPQPSSTVTLGKRRDATGLPRLRLDWRTSADDLRTARTMAQLFAAELSAAGIGRAQTDPGGVPFAEANIGMGCHPMGTARMGDDPAASVVDADLRTHDLDNLFICGSAVFPTGGHANPTMTIVALAHRLAAHLGST